jgi:hypothetical protein
MDTGVSVIELLDFKLRGGQESPVAAARVARISERYLTGSGSREIHAVVAEIVAWVASLVPERHGLRLELSVTSTIVRVSVTASRCVTSRQALGSNRSLREALPMTAALAPRYGVETSRNTRVWAEFDRAEFHRAEFER